MDPEPTPATPPQPPQTPPAPEAQAAPPPGKEEKTLAMLAHVLGAVLGFLVPLILWLIKKDEMPFVNDQGKEALNFQLTVLIAFAACTIVSFVTCGFGAFLFLPVWIADLILGIMAGIKANEGVAYRYPVTLRLVK